MRILIIGAGVTGSLYASFLISSKNKIEKKIKEKVEIKILARGQTYERIKNNGLKVNHHLQEIITIDQIPVIEKLDSHDKYDYVLIFLQKNQLEKLLVTLRENKSSHFIFLGNNGLGNQTLRDSIPPHKITLGFPGSGGYRENDYICSVHKNRPLMTLGFGKESKKKPIKKLKKILKIAKIDAKLSSDMDSWLKYHLSMVSPLAAAFYLDGGDNTSLSKNLLLMKTMTKAIREGYVALKSLKYPIRPKVYRFMMLVPDYFIRIKLSKFLASDLGRLVVYYHCTNSKKEMSLIAEEFQSIVKDSSTNRENLDRLFSVYTK